MYISIHALREEGDSQMQGKNPQEMIFLSTPSARRATEEFGVYAWDPDISIHALREEGDRCAPDWTAARPHFYPRPPRGGRRLTACACTTSRTFLSTPSARRATMQHDLHMDT